MKFGLLNVLALVSVVPLAVALNACGDDSSTSGSSDGGNRGGIPDTVQTMNELLSDIPCGKSQKCVATYLVEYHGKAVCDGEDGWVFGSLIETMDCDFTESSDSRDDEGSSSSDNEDKDYSSDSEKGDLSSSSGAEQISRLEGVKPSGYYARNCPEGVNCKNAMSSFEYLFQYMLVAGEDDEMLDTRDGQVYKVVTIGEQTWMAQNLNYAYTDVGYHISVGMDYTSDSTSWCYDNLASNCDKYGRLYTWSAVMDSAGIVDPDGAGKDCGYGKTCSAASASSATLVRGICPEGWHVPTNAEYGTLYEYLGGSATAGSFLKSTSGWFKNGNGSDKYGFSLVPAGVRTPGGDFERESYYAYLWTATARDMADSWYLLICYEYESVDLYDRNKDYARSLRCLKD